MNPTAFLALVRDAGYNPRSYSGRAMYGRRCVAVVVDRDVTSERLIADLFLTLVCAKYGDYSEIDLEREVTELHTAVRRTRTDGMGLGTVVYWPEMPWPDNEDDSEED